MKIESHQLYDSAGTRRTSASQQSGATHMHAQAGSSGDDRVKLSTDSALVAATVVAVKQAPEIRSHLVELARSLQESGRLGADLDRLADRMLDGALEA